MSEKKSVPSMDEWLREAKKDKDFRECGMYLFHNGVVRGTAKAKVRMGEEAEHQNDPEFLGFVFG